MSAAQSFLGATTGVNSIGDFVYTNGLRQFFDLSSIWAGLGMTTQQGPNSTGNGTARRLPD